MGKNWLSVTRIVREMLRLGQIAEALLKLAICLVTAVFESVRVQLKCDGTR